MEAAETTLRLIAAYTALIVEAIAVVVIAFGSFETIIYLAGQTLGVMPRTPYWRRDLFVRFGRWLIMGLQFALAADIVRSVITPTWNDIGQLAAIALIRTFLNYFLEKDLEEMSDSLAGEKKAPAA
jgi:uncharacterized membrane protein